MRLNNCNLSIILTKVKNHLNKFYYGKFCYGKLFFLNNFIYYVYTDSSGGPKANFEIEIPNLKVLPINTKKINIKGKKAPICSICPLLIKFKVVYT